MSFLDSVNILYRKGWTIKPSDDPCCGNHWVRTIEGKDAVFGCICKVNPWSRPDFCGDIACEKAQNLNKD